MHLKRQCSLLMVLCSMGVFGYPRNTEHQTVKRDVEREKDGSDSQARTLELKMNKAHPPYVSIHSSESVFFNEIYFVFPPTKFMFDVCLKMEST